MSEMRKNNGHLPPEQSPLTPRGLAFIRQHILQPLIQDGQIERAAQFEKSMDTHAEWLVEGTIARMEIQFQAQEGELNV